MASIFCSAVKGKAVWLSAAVSGLLIWGAASRLQAEALPLFTTEPVAFRLDGAVLEEFSLGDDPIGKGGMRFRNGRNGEEVEVVSTEGGRLQLTGLEGVSATLAATERPEGYTALTLTVINEGADELWLEAELELPFSAKAIRYYNGYEPQGKPGQREGISGGIPFASLYEEGGRGLAAGINPEQIRSYLANAADWSDGRGTLRYLTRMVVPAGEQEVVEWVIFAYRAKYGHLDAIHCYQQFFPSRFRAAPDVDPNVLGHAYGQAFWRSFHEGYTPIENFTPNRGEFFRRLGHGWDWAYGAFGGRPGDWLSTEELTSNWKMRHHPEQATYQEWRGQTATERLKQHNEALVRAEPFGLSALLYLIPTYCEEDLAYSHYSDSIYYDENGNPRPAGPPWVFSYDRSLQMYCYGNSFGDYTFSVLPTILGREGVSGIAFDCMDRSRYNYFGPGVERSPGTAYEPGRGRYANMDTAAALFTRRVHEIVKDGVRMSVAGNVRAYSSSYLVCGEIDAAIIERPPWDQNPRPDLLRLMLGQKPITFWHGYQKLPNLPENPEELIKLASNLSDYALHRSFELGIYLNYKTLSGFPKLMYYNRYTREFFGDLGWQTIPAIQPDRKELLRSRFGEGVGAAFFLGNTTPADIETTVTMDVDYVGADAYLVGDAEGTVSIPNQLDENRYGPLTVVSREPRLLRIYASLPRGVAGKGHVDAQIIPGERSQLKLEFTVKRSGSVPMEFFIPPGYEAGALRANGQPVKWTAAEDNTVLAEVDLKEGINHITLEWLPETELLNREAIVEFPFVTESGEAGFAVCAADASIGQRAVERLSWFFGAALNGIEPGKPSLRIGQVKAGQAGKGSPVLYIGDPDFLKKQGLSVPEAVLGSRNGIYRDGNALVVVLNQNVDDALDQLLGLLEPSYPIYGYVSMSKEVVPWTAVFMPTYFTEKTGMAYLPWKKKEGK